MKKLLIGIVVIVIIVVIGILSIGRAPEDVERADIKDIDESMISENGDQDSDVMEFNEMLQKKVEEYDLSSLNFKFTGYGPGKSHDGTFTGISIANIEHNNQFITKGDIKFYVKSVDTGIAKLDADLCFENFFNCDTYPEILFSLTNVSRTNESELAVVGNLTFKGTTKEISFPVRQDGEKVSADFILDVAQFGFTAPSIVDNEVRIQFDTTL